MAKSQHTLQKRNRELKKKRKAEAKRASRKDRKQKSTDEVAAGANDTEDKRQQ